jgi:multidrug efflux pump
MNLSSPFVKRPIATVLLTIGVALAGIAGFFVLPVSPLPQVDFPVIGVNASIPGASPDTMASSVATPLERWLGVIPGINEMTSSSGLGQTRVTLQFDLNRDIDGAAREVQAAINASRADLPATLKSNPTYRKANPSDAPVMILALTSETRTPQQIYDAVSNVVQQKVATVQGVGDVEIGGGSLPAVRVDLNLLALNQLGIPLDDVRAAIQASNANRPKGAIEGGGRRLQIYTNTRGRTAAEYVDLVVAYRNGTAVKLSDVATVTDGPEDSRTLGLFNGRPAVIVLITRQPSANIIATVDSVRALIPELKAQLPADIDIQVASDSTNSIRASLHEVEITLLISVVLVIVVVGAFLRNLRATIVPAVATVVSLLGTFGVMALLHYSLDNLSLMALTVATGFVVDDAIVVLENTSRHIEHGMNRLEAALKGAREVGFTVLSISISLVAVFIPLLFMGGQAGRLFREFAVTLSAAVLISLVVSLTTTPMLCAWWLNGPRRRQDDAPAKPPGRLSRLAGTAFQKTLRVYETSLDWAIASPGIMMAILAGVVAINVWLYIAVPKGFFPQQDSGQMNGGLRADQSISFTAMRGKLRELVDILRHDPDVATVVGFTGGSRAGGGFVFVNLKPRSERNVGAQAVIARLRPKLAQVTGVSLFLNPVQDLRMGGRQSNSTFQYTLKSDNAADLKRWASRLAEAMKASPVLTDVDTDQQDNGVEAYVTIDRDAASRSGVTDRDIDNALYNAFGQRQVATVYGALNQYHVVMEVMPDMSLGPTALDDIQVAGAAATSSTGSTGSTSGSGATVAASTTSSSVSATSATGTSTPDTTGATGTTATSATTPAAITTSTTPAAVSANPGARDASTGATVNTQVRTMVPLSTVAFFGENAVRGSVNHQDGELATTVSFNLPEGKSLSDARTAIEDATNAIHMPTNVRGSMQGTAAAFEQNQGQQPMLILAALVVIYLVLGILYENLVHPLTVLSTLPSAGVGAVLALMLFGMEFSLIALIGVFLLIGIVKKNAILIIDFALDAERARGLTAAQAVREACLLRFRPILMTTLAAALGALPLAVGFGDGAELRRPLGVAIVGGLIASQLLTLLTTPVVYLLLDKLRRPTADEAGLARHPAEEPA